MRTFLPVFLLLFLAHLPGYAGEEAAADRKTLTRILDEMQWLPTLPGAAEKPLGLEALPKFSAKKLAEYAALPRGDATEREYRDADKDKYAQAHPLRAAIFAGVEAMEQATRVPMPATLTRPVITTGAIGARFRAELAKRAQNVGALIFDLERELARMNEAGAKRDAEKEKRWHANFDVARARLEANILYLYEYSYMLGLARIDKLPPLTPGHPGWQMTPRPKITIPEPKAKSLAKETMKHWQRIQEAYPGTPWAWLAERESRRELGLAWSPRKE